MSWYGEHVVPRLVNVACGMKTTRPQRARVCADLRGEVLEIGFGSGLNVPFYPAEVTRVDAVEPADLGWQLASKRLAASSTNVERVDLDAEKLSAADASVDCALSTWTLCTIPHPVVALREVRRVLRPGGSLHFIEHGLAPDSGVQKWQRRIEPVQKRVAGGCHLTRHVPEMLEAAGFTVTSLEVFYEPGAPKPLGAMYQGVATAAA